MVKYVRNMQIKGQRKRLIRESLSIEDQIKIINKMKDKYHYLEEYWNRQPRDD